MSDRVANRPEGAPAPGLYLAGIVALALVFALGGAYDTDNLGLAHRIGLWLTVSLLLVGQTAAIDALLTRMLPVFPGCRLLAAGLAMTATLFLMTAELGALKYTPLLPKQHDPFWEFLLFLAPLVLAVSGFVLLLRHFAGPVPQRLAERAGSVMRQIALRPVIAGLLPAPDHRATDYKAWPAGRILLVEANDHYLEVTAETGRVFLRGRMRDVVARLRGAGGLQVHRSWWVALDQIARVERDGRDYEIRLRDGRRLPVGRSRIGQLRSRGLI